MGAVAEDEPILSQRPEQLQHRGLMHSGDQRQLVQIRRSATQFVQYLQGTAQALARGAPAFMAGSGVVSWRTSAPR